MNKEQRVVLIIITITLFISSAYLSFKCINYKEELNNTVPPFNSLSIINKKIKLDTKRKYEIELDCSKLTPNEQLISYKLKKDFINSEVSISTEVFKNNKLLKDSYDTATNINSEIIIKNNKYEQVYIIKGICKAE